MSEVICIDGNFNSEQLTEWAKYGIVYPEQDKLYNIREVVKHTTGETGVRLEEIKNPPYPLEHPILGKTMFEPTFNIKRFRNLDMSELRKEELELVNSQ